MGPLLGRKMWVSFQVNAAAIIVSLSIGLPLGFWVAHKQGSWKDPAIVALTLILMSIPIMVTVPALLWALCLKLHWIPCSGWGGLIDPRIVVPAITMGVPGIAGFVRLMRASTLDVLGQDFIRTAKSKGLKPHVVDTRHVFRNAMIPIVSVVGLQVGGLLGGAVILESIFVLPGLGRGIVQAVVARDYPVIQSLATILVVLMLSVNLIVDMAYALLDSRISYDV